MVGGTSLGLFWVCPCILHRYKHHLSWMAQFSILNSENVIGSLFSYRFEFSLDVSLNMWAQTSWIKIMQKKILKGNKLQKARILNGTRGNDLTYGKIHQYLQMGLQCQHPIVEWRSMKAGAVPGRWPRTLEHGHPGRDLASNTLRASSPEARWLWQEPPRQHPVVEDARKVVGFRLPRRRCRTRVAGGQEEIGISIKN